jgi:hypothetical protein
MSASRHGATFSLPDGRAFSIGGGAGRPRGVASAAQNVSVNVEGLKPGQTVLITVSFDPTGDVHISIKLVDEPTSGDESQPEPPSCGDPTAKAGAVVGINSTDGLLTISRPWGEDPQTYHASSEQLSHVHYGDEVLVRFDPESSQVTDVKIVHSTVTAPDPGMLVADGTVNSTNADAGQFTIVQSNRGGRLTFNAPCWILSQVWASEDVHVVYHTEANGDTVADAVDPNDGSEFEH